MTGLALTNLVPLAIYLMEPLATQPKGVLSEPVRVGEHFIACILVNVSAAIGGFSSSMYGGNVDVCVKGNTHINGVSL